MLINYLLINLLVMSGIANYDLNISKSTAYTSDKIIHIDVTFTNNSQKSVLIENPKLFKDNCFYGSPTWNLKITNNEDKCYYLALPIVGKKQYLKDIKVKGLSKVKFHFIVDLNNLSLDGFHNDNTIYKNNNFKLVLTLNLKGETIESNVLML